MNCTIAGRKMVFFIISFVIVAVFYALTWNWTDIRYRFLCSNQNTTGFCMEAFTLSSNSLHNRSMEASTLSSNSLHNRSMEASTLSSNSLHNRSMEASTLSSNSLHNRSMEASTLSSNSLHNRSMEASTLSSNSLHNRSMEASTLSSNSLHNRSMEAFTLSSNSLHNRSMKAFTLSSNSLHNRSMEASTLSSNSLHNRSMEASTLSSNSLHNRSIVDENKIILLWTGVLFWYFKEGNQTFVEGRCPESRCIITKDKNYENHSSAILFHMRDLEPESKLPHRDYQQYWIFGIFESPVHTYYTGLPKYRNAFNLTFTYKRTSDLYLPGGDIYPKNKITRSTVPLDAINRTKLILWYVSNCGPALRLNYAKELSKYVQVDIFGRCGKHDPCTIKFMNYTCTAETKLKYKFYLAFENSRCPDYITEKFWLSLEQNIVPIVLGPKIADYEKVAPPHSFIHVDNFTSPKHLAEYIKYLDKNDEAYYEYHMWRNKYEAKSTGYNYKPYCKLCSMLHKTVYTHEQRDIEEFWSQKQCF